MNTLLDIVIALGLVLLATFLSHQFGTNMRVAESILLVIAAMSFLILRRLQTTQAEILKILKQQPSFVSRFYRRKPTTKA